MTEIYTLDTLKTVREALCLAQSALIRWPNAGDRPSDRVETLSRLIANIDQQRPLAADGTHTGRALCTPTCGCEDPPPVRRGSWVGVVAGLSSAVPHLGADVHYLGAVGVCRAAKVTARPGDFEPGDPVSLVVFGEPGAVSWHESRESAFGTEPGTWHWPGCCETGA